MHFVGSLPRNDLCAGTVQLIIDGNINTIVTIYLDSKPQVVDIAGKQHILKFVQGLQLLLINGHPFRTEFGGMPMVVYVNQVKHYLRLTALPTGVKLNNVKLWKMEGNEVLQRNPSPTPNVPKKLGQSQDMTQGDTSNVNLNPPSPSTLANDNSQEALNVAVQSNAAFDRLLNMIPTTPTNLGGGLKMPNQPSSKSSLPEDTTFQNCSYTSTPIREAKKPTWKNELNKQLEHNTEGSESATKESEKPVDVHNLWAQLLGAGLVSNPATTTNTQIPGLESTITEESKIKNEESNAEEANKNDDEKGKQNKKKGKLQKKSGTEETSKEEKEGKNVRSFKEVVLKSHHSTIKK